MFICPNPQISGTDQGNTVPNGKNCDEADNVFQACQIENNPGQKQQVVISRDHVFGTYPDIGPQPTVVEYLLVRGGDPMCEAQKRSEQENGNN